MFRQDQTKGQKNRRSKTEEQKVQEIQPENPVLSKDTPPEQIPQLEQPSDPITGEESTIIQTDDMKEGTKNDSTENGNKEVFVSEDILEEIAEQVDVSQDTNVSVRSKYSKPYPYRR